MTMIKIFFILVVAFSTVSYAGEGVQEPLHLNLSKAMGLASQENAQVFAANERVRQAIANISVNRSALLPQLTGTFGGKRQTTDLRSSGIKLSGDPHIGPFNSFDTRGRLTLEIFDPQAIERLQKAKAGEKLSQAEFQKVRGDILALVGALFLEAQRASQSISLNEVSLKQSMRRYEISQLRLKQGVGSVSDLEQARMTLASVDYLLKASKVRAEQTRLDLASSLRIPLDLPILFDADEGWEVKELQGAIGQDLAVAQAQLTQSKAALNESKAGFFPKLTAFGDYGRSGQSPSSSSNTYSLGALVSVPFWEGGSKQSQLKIAKSKLKENEILLEEALSQNQVKIKEAKNNIDQAKILLISKQEQLNYVMHQALLADHRFKSGLGSQIEADEANTIQAMAVDEKNEAQALFWTAKINLAHAMGSIDQLFEIK